jgi:hypothetical protein
MPQQVQRTSTQIKKLFLNGHVRKKKVFGEFTPLPGWPYFQGNHAFKRNDCFVLTPGRLEMLCYHLQFLEIRHFLAGYRIRHGTEPQDQCDASVSVTTTTTTLRRCRRKSCLVADTERAAWSDASSGRPGARDDDSPYDWASRKEAGSSVAAGEATVSA